MSCSYYKVLIKIKQTIVLLAILLSCREFPKKNSREYTYYSAIMLNGLADLLCSIVCSTATGGIDFY